MVTALFAAACGSDSDGDDAATTTTAAGSDGQTDASSSSDPFAPQPLAEPYTINMTTPVRIEVFSQPLLADLFGELEAENLSLEVSDTRAR